ncbi:MAG: type II toxin-antitoxin system HicA family toxin [Bryobacteraceae bacterium]
MKLPRNVSGDRLIRELQRLGYCVVREKGSHVRLTHRCSALTACKVRLDTPISLTRLLH